MAAGGAYGERFGSVFGLEQAQTLAATKLQGAQIIVTRLRCDVEVDHKTGRVQPERAFSIGFAQRALPKHKLWLNGRLVHTDGYESGSVSVVDFESEPSAHISCSFDCLQFYVTRDALDDMAAEIGVPRVETLDWPRGRRDPIIANLATALQPALEEPASAEALFIDCVLVALQAHIAHTYGGMRTTPSLLRGGLAPWQERRAKAFIEERLDGDLSIAELAQTCELSRSHFARAFKQTLGMTPHRWLMLRRIERAKELMLSSPSPLADIALSCGFADQSHFTRVFSTIVSMSPASWRRTQLV